MSCATARGTSSRVPRPTQARNPRTSLGTTSLPGSHRAACLEGAWAGEKCTGRGAKPGHGGRKPQAGRALTRYRPPSRSWAGRHACRTRSSTAWSSGRRRPGQASRFPRCRPERLPWGEFKRYSVAIGQLGRASGEAHWKGRHPRCLAHRPARQQRARAATAGPIAYTHRNHYPLAQWFPANVRKGYLEDITRAVGGDRGVEARKVYDGASMCPLGWHTLRHTSPATPSYAECRSTKRPCLLTRRCSNLESVGARPRSIEREPAPGPLVCSSPSPAAEGATEEAPRLDA